MKVLPIISRHAIDRYRDRVESTATPQIAAEHISRILETATASSRPRHWMRPAATAPGTRYLYSAAYPHVGLVVADGVVVTLHSRNVCRSWLPAGSHDEGRSGRRVIPYRRVRGWWLGLEAA